MTLLLSLLTILNLSDSTPRLYAFHQPQAQRRPSAEATMEGQMQLKKQDRPGVYLIWLAAKAPQKVTISRVYINGLPVDFDTAHEKGPLHISTGLRAPFGTDSSKIELTGAATFIRIRLTESNQMGTDYQKAGTESIRIRYRRNFLCRKTITAPIQGLAARVEE